MALRIGITESSDPSHDRSWLHKLPSLSGIIIVTKGLAQPGMIEDILVGSHIKPMILHCTCTGWGGTAMETGVPDTEDTMRALEQLIQKGFPAKNVVLRVDPIIPTQDGLAHVSKVLALLQDMNTRLAEPVTRVRVSIMDNYKHVMKRFEKAGYDVLYNGEFQCGLNDIRNVSAVLRMYPEFQYFGCAETRLASMTNDMVKPQGCISKEDLYIMGLHADFMLENLQNRSGCHCLSCKTEVLQGNHTCPHACLYCYWKRPGE